MTTPEKITIMISLISAIATVAAAFIYFKTLNELKKQTGNTYRPHLFIDTIGFSVVGVQQNDITMPVYWADKTVKRNTIYDFDNNQNTHIFNLECYNIGFGTAKKVATVFKYDLKAFVAAIKELENHVEKNLRIEIDAQSDFVHFKPTNEKMPYNMHSVSYRNTLKDYLSYILPANIHKEPVSIQLPMLYLDLLNVFVFYFSKITDKSGLDIDKIIDNSIPNIFGTITYQDIYNHEKKLEIEILVSFHHLSSAGYGGTFEVKEK